MNLLARVDAWKPFADYGVIGLSLLAVAGFLAWLLRLLINKGYGENGWMDRTIKSNQEVVAATKEHLKHSSERLDAITSVQHQMTELFEKIDSRQVQEHNDILSGVKEVGTAAERDHLRMLDAGYAACDVLEKISPESKSQIDVMRGKLRGN